MQLDLDQVMGKLIDWDGRTVGPRSVAAQDDGHVLLTDGMSHLVNPATDVLIQELPRADDHEATMATAFTPPTAAFTGGKQLQPMRIKPGSRAHSGTAKRASLTKSLIPASQVLGR